MTRKTMKLLMLGWGLMGLCLFACQPDEQAERLAADGGVPVIVRLSLSTSEPEADAATRAASSLVPDVENLIYDIWVVQYNERGIRLNKRHYRRDEPGELQVSLPVVLSAAPNCTVCLLVNMGYGTDAEPVEWPDNLPAYKKMMVDLDVVAAQKRSGAEGTDEEGMLQRMPMCGYWQGTIEGAGESLSVSLGRMMTRINLALVNGTGLNLTNVTVGLANVPRRGYIFPQVDVPDLTETDYYGEADKEAFRDRIPSFAGKDAKGNPVSTTANLYYYIAPNFCSSAERATMLEVTAFKEGGSVSAPLTSILPLGTDAPGTTGRNLTLYPNNIYTFTVTLTSGGD